MVAVVCLPPSSEGAKVLTVVALSINPQSLRDSSFSKELKGKRDAETSRLIWLTFKWFWFYFIRVKESFQHNYNRQANYSDSAIWVKMDIALYNSCY